MATYDELRREAERQIALEDEARRQIAVEDAANKSASSDETPGKAASLAAGFKEGGRRAAMGVGQIGVGGGFRPSITELMPDVQALRELEDTGENRRAFERAIMEPSNVAAAMRNEPYRRSHPLLFGAGEIGFDVAATLPLALATKNPTLTGFPWLQRALTVSKAAIPVGAGQGAMIGAISPTQTGLGPQEYDIAKSAQIGIGGLGGAVAGAVTAPVADIGLRGLMGLVRGAASPVMNRLRPSPVKPSPAELELIENRLEVPGVLSLDELSGNPALQRTAVNLEMAPNSGMTEYRQSQQQRLKELAERQAASADLGGPVPAPQVVTRELERVTDAERMAMQKEAESAVAGARPPNVMTADSGVQEGLRGGLKQRKKVVRELYRKIPEQLKQEGLQGSPVDVAPIESAVSRWFGVINPDTWKSISETRLGRTLTAIKDGLARTQQLESMPYDNLMAVLDDSGTRAAARFPEEVGSLLSSLRTSDRGAVVNAIRRLNWLEEAKPVDVLGPRPSGGVGIARKIWELGGIKKDYMEDVLGESKFQKGMMPGLFRENGQSPDYMALRLQEEGFPVDDSVEGVQRMFDLIKQEAGGGRKTLSAEQAGQEQLQAEYESALQRAAQGSRELENNPAWMPGRALDWEGVERLKKDLNDLYGKERKISGRVGSVEQAAYADLLNSVNVAQGNWAYSTGSPRILQLHNEANKYYAENIPQYDPGGIPGVNAVMEAETADGAVKRLFSPKAPESANRVFGMMTPEGQQASKMGIWDEAMESAMKTGRFDREAFEGAFRRNQAVTDKTFNPQDKAAVANILEKLDKMSVDRDVERAVAKSIETGDADALLKQFAAANNPSRAQRITQRLMSPESKRAVESWILNRAYESATKKGMTTDGGNLVREGWFSPMAFSGELTKYSQVLQQVVSPERYKELQGLMVLMDRAKRAGQYNEYPPTGARLWSVAQGYAPIAIIGGLFGTYQGGGDTTAIASGAIAGAGVRFAGERLIRSFLTSPKGRAVLRRMAGYSGDDADKALQSPGISALLQQIINTTSATKTARDESLNYGE